jgi:chaperonin GroES
VRVENQEPERDANRVSLAVSLNWINKNENMLGKETHMAKIKLRPLDDRVVVEPLEAEEMTAGGIVLPDAAQEKPQRGKVVATGPGKLLDSGNRGELSVKVGDEVIFGKYGGSEVEVDGEEYKILRESDILAKVMS